MDCTRFEELLFEELEGLLDEDRAPGLRAHAAGCSRCRELQALLVAEADALGVDFTESVLSRTTRADPRQRVLRRLQRDLPLLASMPPDEDFVADVMAATVEADRRRLGHRLRALWHGLVRRPRFALEGAYVGALVVFLLFGVPGSPLSEVPGAVLGELRDGGAVVRTAVAGGTERATELGRVGWRRAGELLTAPAGRGLAEAEAIRSWRNTARGLLESFWEATLAPAIEWIRTTWLGLRGPASDSPSPSEPDPNPRGANDDRVPHHA